MNEDLKRRLRKLSITDLYSAYQFAKATRMGSKVTSLFREALKRRLKDLATLEDEPELLDNPEG